IQQFFGDETAKVVPIPTAAAAYNDEMNHIDRGDQLRSYTSYNHPLRRGAWQALTWTFLLDVALTNSYILQLHGPQPNWERYKSQEDWRKCILNALFNTYHQESQARKLYRSGAEEDINDQETRQKHIDRNINHIYRGRYLRCLACQGFRQGQIRSKGPNRHAFAEISGNARGRHHSPAD
ncbi:hypothetical protein FOC1_g10000088, partial [Fusarium oxysporum f. sp. cubense race 1]